MSECIFCKIVKGEIPAEIVYQDELVVAFKDIKPAAPTHFLIVPREHISSVSDADSSHQGILGQLMLAAKSIAKTYGITESGFRLVVNNGADAGQVVFHIHVHMLAGRALGWPPG